MPQQVTFLHLFHHSSITLVVGSILRFDYSGDMFLPIVLNSIVHVLMYSHYFVTALGIKTCECSQVFQVCSDRAARYWGAEPASASFASHFSS